MTETTNLFSDSAEPLSKDGATPEVADGSRPESGAAGSSAEQAGAVRSWPGSPAADQSSGTGRGGRLPAMLLPELQRLAQSLGITGTGRMRKGQLIAAIEDRQHGAGALGSGGPGAGQAPVAAQPASTGPASTGPAVAASGAGRSVPDRGHQSKANGNSVKRSAPAGAGANRPFEQDAMESEGSGQLSMVSEDSSGLGAGSPSGPVTRTAPAAATVQPHGSAAAEPGSGPAGGSAGARAARRPTAPTSPAPRSAGSVAAAAEPGAGGWPRWRPGSGPGRDRRGWPGR